MLEGAEVKRVSEAFVWAMHALNTGGGDDANEGDFEVDEGGDGGERGVEELLVAVARVGALRHDVDFERDF